MPSNRANLVDTLGDSALGSNQASTVQALRALSTAELRTAQGLNVDRDATAALKAVGGLEQAAEMIDGPALDLAVRGKYVVVVSQTRTGRPYKECLLLDHFDRTPPAEPEEPQPSGPVSEYDPSAQEAAAAAALKELTPEAKLVKEEREAEARVEAAKQAARKPRGRKPAAKK